MNLGFLGSGAITSAIVTGLNAETPGRHSILLSPRNAGVAAALAGRFPGVAVASSNQEVLDASETVVVAVRPQIVRSVLAELHFRPDHHVISVVAATGVGTVAKMVAPATKVTRAVPLPSAAKRQCPTGVHPNDPVAVELFAELGTAFAVDTEEEFEAICAATATMASYFAFADAIASWLERRGVAPAKARQYTAQVLSGLADTAAGEPERTFESLASDHATRGGLNEQVRAYLTERGMFESVSEALDGVMRRAAAGRQ